MNEGPPAKPVGMSVLLKGHKFPPIDPLPKEVVSDPPVREPLVNLKEAEKFLNALAGDGPVTFQTFDDKGKDKSLIRIMHGTFGECSKELTDLNRRGAGIYVMVNEGDGKGRKEVNVVAVRALLLDLDGSPLEPVLEWTVKAHIITETSPGRYQCFWVVKDFPLDKALLSTVQEAIRTKFGGDPKVTKDLNRVMRVPGLFHNKKEPYLSKLLQVNDHPPYSTEEILKALDIDAGGPKPKKVVSNKPIVEPVIPEGSRNSTLTSLAGAMRKKGSSVEAIIMALQVDNEQRCEPPLETDEVATIAESVSRYKPTEIPPMQAGQKFFPMPYIGAIMNQFKIIGHAGQFYRYQDGVYRLWAEQEVSKHIMGLLGNHARQHQVKEILGMLETSCNGSGEVNRPGLLNLNNGVLDPKSGQLHAHSPEYYMTTQIPVEWNPKAECPSFEKFLQQVLPEEGQRTLLMQLFGYALTADTSFHKGFILLGSGANGKSVCMSILQALLGPNWSATGLSQLKQRFAIAELRNKTANISSEINVKDFVDDATIKQIISGDPIQADRKHKAPVKFSPMVKLIITANSLPKTFDKSHGYFRRWVILPFEITIPEEKQDRTLAQRIIENELSGVLRRSVVALRGLYESGNFTIPESSRNALRDYEREMNPALEFFEERVKTRPGQDLLLKDLYEQYRYWCHSTGHQRMTNQKLRDVFEKHYRVKKERNSKGIVFRGYRVVDEK